LLQERVNVADISQSGVVNSWQQLFGKSGNHK